MESGNLRVQVHGDWDGWQSAEVFARDIEDVHWLQPPGAPHPLLHGFVWCGDILTGQIPHDCAAGSGTHRLLVCILKRHAVASTYEALAQRVAKGVRHPSDPTRRSPGVRHPSDPVEAVAQRRRFSPVFR